MYNDVGLQPDRDVDRLVPAVIDVALALVDVAYGVESRAELAEAQVCLACERFSSTHLVREQVEHLESHLHHIC